MTSPRVAFLLAALASTAACSPKPAVNAQPAKAPATTAALERARAASRDALVNASFATRASGDASIERLEVEARAFDRAAEAWAPLAGTAESDARLLDARTQAALRRATISHAKATDAMRSAALIELDRVRAVAIRSTTRAGALAAVDLSDAAARLAGLPSNARDARVSTAPLRREVALCIEARTHFLSAVAPSLEDAPLRARFEWEIAQAYFASGHMSEAAARFRRIWQDECGKSPYGLEAWERLIVIGNVVGDRESLLQLTQAERNRPCACDEEQRRHRDDIQGEHDDLFFDARRVFERAQKATGDERAPLLRDAAVRYEAVLRRRLGSYDPNNVLVECAVNAAWAHGELGELDAQVSLLREIITRWGDAESREILRDLGNEKRYRERVELTVFAMKTLADVLATKKHDAAAAGLVLRDIVLLEEAEPDARRAAVCAALAAFREVKDGEHVTEMRRLAREIDARCPPS